MIKRFMDSFSSRIFAIYFLHFFCCYASGLQKTKKRKDFLKMPLHLKPLQRHFLVFPDSGLSLGNFNLLLYRIHSIQIR